MKSIQNAAAFVFIIGVSILSLISILGIWEFFDNDVIFKSLQTLSLISFVAVVVMVAGKTIEQRQGIMEPFVPHPLFRTIKQITVFTLIASFSVLALLGILAIWEVINDKEVLYKTLSSLGILAGASLLILLTCLYREKDPAQKSSRNSLTSAFITIAVIIGIVWLGRILLYSIF